VVNRVDRSNHFKSFDDPFIIENRDQITIFDWHIHSLGPDSNSKPADIYHQASTPFLEQGFKRQYAYAQTFLDSVALSDHDTMQNNEEAARLAKETGLLHILGVELTTSFNGIFPHILLFHHQQQVLDSLFVALKQSMITVPTYLPMMMRSLLYAGLRYPTAPNLEQVLEVLQDFPDILVIVPHPEVGERRDLLTGTNFNKRRNRPLTSLTLDEVETFLPHIDGIEIINGQYNPGIDKARLDFCEEFDLPGFGFSDAHTAIKVGSVASFVSGKFADSESLLQAVKTLSVGTVTQHVSVKEKGKSPGRQSRPVPQTILQPA
jgi:hypothetical protein